MRFAGSPSIPTSMSPGTGPAPPAGPLRSAHALRGTPRPGRPALPGIACGTSGHAPSPLAVTNRARSVWIAQREAPDPTPRPVLC
jgi:hypothetical protein